MLEPTAFDLTEPRALRDEPRNWRFFLVYATAIAVVLGGYWWLATSAFAAGMAVVQ